MGATQNRERETHVFHFDQQMFSAVQPCILQVVEYRIPRYIRFVKEFQRTAIGKVQKFRLLEQLQQELRANK
jgi:non-ribosomal peptide synthetase component E (peptide arylation enzyme)